MILGY